jgi:hypothetical protein
MNTSSALSTFAGICGLELMASWLADKPISHNRTELLQWSRVARAAVDGKKLITKSAGFLA